MKRSWLILSLSLLAAGCAAGSRTGGDDSGRDRRGNLISAEELSRFQFQTAYDMIRSLRPHWLQMRGAQSVSNPSAGEVRVYVDGMPFGGPAFLRQIMNADVHEVRYLSAAEATTRYGTDHGGGAILVTTRRR